VVAQFPLLLYSRLHLRADGDMGGSISVSQFETEANNGVLNRYSASTFGLINGGLAGLVWTYLGAYAGFLMVIASMAEMASMRVTAIEIATLLTVYQGPNIRRSISLVNGCVMFYRALADTHPRVSEFAPKGAQKFLSYMTGKLVFAFADEFI
jgi:hypothetical protein